MWLLHHYFFWTFLTVRVSAISTEGRVNSVIRRSDGNDSYLPWPSMDPWYNATDGWEATIPGTVLRVRPHAYNLSPLPIVNANDTFQILFRTTNSLGDPTWAVTTVFTSTRQCNNTSVKNCTHGIVSYQLPYDSSCLDTSPSWGLQFGEPYGEMAEMLGRGWWVSVPDYEGPLAAYGANILSGYVIIDSVRAVLQVLDQFGFPTNLPPRAALWGYSNGASATDVAAEIAATYAPELKLAGAAIGGLAPNLSTSGPLINSGQIAGLLVQGIIGITAQYTEQREYLNSRLNPSGLYNVTEFFSALYMSGWESLLHFAYQDIFEYFIGGQADLETPEMTNLFLKEGTLGTHGTPNMPVFMYHAIDDGTTPIEETDAIVAKYCADGANVLYHRNSFGNHNDELTDGRQRALDFLGAVLDGTTAPDISIPPTGCQTVNLTFMQDPNTPIF